ncbi:hypothetical protein Leryth_011203 [Lithospermum erythrorhizon]|nr:hypothetical protein Leryth_011203 [Lithospermum erythrorhizon]
MEAEAKDSEEEKEHVPTEPPHSCRKVQSPQNLRIEKSLHQPSLVELETLRNNKCSNASVVFAGTENCNDMPSVTKKKATTSCSTSGLEGIWNKNLDLPDAFDTHTFGEVSGSPLNRYATVITPEKVRNNFVSTSRTAEKSPSRSSTRSKSRRSPTKGGLPTCSALRKSNPASTLTEDKGIFNVSDGFNLSLSIEKPSETSSAVVKTPVKHLSHLKQSTTDDLPDKREVGVSGHNGKSQKESNDLAALARSSHTGGPYKTVSHFSASKVASGTAYQHDLDDPSNGDSIKDIWNSSGLANSNMSKEVGPDSDPKQGRKKMLARKVLGTSSRFGNWSSMNKKGSIRSNINSGEKQGEDGYHETVKLLNPSADKNINATIQTSNTREPRLETITKARPLDDETETPEDEADVFYVASHKDELDPITSEKEPSASGGASNNDELLGGNELIKTDKENGKCAAVCSVTDEVNVKGDTTAERMDKGKKRPLSKTKENAEFKKDLINRDTVEKMPKKIKNDTKTKKKAKNPLITSGRTKGKDQVTRNKENSKCNTACSARDAPTKTSIENCTAETMENPRKRQLTKTKNHQNVKKAANNREMREKVSKVVVNNEQTVNEETNSTTSGQSKIPAQEKPKSSLNVEKENTPINFPANCDKRNSGKVSAKSKKKPETSELKGMVSNYGPGLAEHATKVKEPMWFLVSGHKFQRKEFQQVIKRLRGRVCRDSHNWSYQATHLILPDPIRRTEKFFAAVASGRWILKTDYLTASNEAGKFLDEQPYEWHKNSLTEDGSINLVAPQKWRLIRSRTGHGSFYGLRIIVYGECIAPPLDTLKRAVKAGDGTILATSPPYTRFLESDVDFAIVSPGMPRVDIWIQEFLRHEIPCVLADYLVDYVCKPGYSLDKHVQYGTHSWAERSLNNLESRIEEIVEDQALPEDMSSESDIACQICKSRDREDVMLICGDESGLSGCGTGMHIDCCDPPLSEVPLDDWFCPKCRTTESPNNKKSRGTRD